MGTNQKPAPGLVQAGPPPARSNPPGSPIRDRDVPAQGSLWVCWVLGGRAGTAQRCATAPSGRPRRPRPCPRSQWEPPFPATSPPHPSPFIPSRSPPFPSPLPGRQIKAWTCESRGTKATHKGGRPCAALLAARPEQGDGDLAPSPGLSQSPCPLLSLLSAPPWGPGAAVGNASGKRGVLWGQDDVPGDGVRIWSG